MAIFLADFLMESSSLKQYQFTSRTWEYFLKSLQERLAIADSSVRERDTTNSLTPELQLDQANSRRVAVTTGTPPTTNTINCITTTSFTSYNTPSGHTHHSG